MKSKPVPAGHIKNPKLSGGHGTIKHPPGIEPKQGYKKPSTNP